MKKNKKKLLIIPIFYILYSIFLNPVRAQNVIKMTAIPPRLELEVAPGQVIIDQLKIRNEGDTQLGLQLEVQDFVVNDKEGTPLPIEEQIADRWAASLWITVSPQKFLLNPGETKVLDFVAVVPEDAAPGGHYAIVFYSPVPGNLEQDGTQTGVSPNVGSLIYFTVAGDINEDARVSLMDVPKFQEYGPVEIKTEIQNLSDIHIRPIGAIKIYNWLGRHSQTLKLEEQNVFPTTARSFENTWNQKWGLGKYKAQLEATYGTQGKILLATVFFWIIPWRAMAICLLIIVLIILLIVYFKKPKEIAKS
ncbi:hypothetical protein ISS42_01420 [Candidatus Shapirobacteria bacterium]|nr:hypothetical protein [Candidatus Shapirobacteria bacterium]